MKLTSVITKIKNLLQSTEMFARPSKKLPGKWQLYEFYIDEANELKHVNFEQLTSEKQNLNIEFTQEKKYIINSNLSIPLIPRNKKGSWSISKNFISIVHHQDFRENIEFQFAFERGNLKLLKKNKFGKIEFFGFFKKLD